MICVRVWFIMYSYGLKCKGMYNYYKSKNNY